MSAFGEVTYEGGQPSADSTTTTHGANGQAASNAEVIDINDPLLTSETLTENPAGDSYAVPPPIPDAKWRAKLTALPVKDAKGIEQPYIAKRSPKMNHGLPYLVTAVQAQILDSSGKYDGIKINQYNVKTAVGRDDSSDVSTILTKLKQPLTPSSPAERMKQFLKVLASEPELVVETAWEASCEACQKAAKAKGEWANAFLLGMHRFPMAPTGGGRDPVVFCPVCKAQCRARAKISMFWPLDTPHNK